MLVSAIRYGAHPTSGSLLQALMLIVGAAFIGGLLLLITRTALHRWRSVWHGWRARRRRTREAALAERRARMMMSELCPHGWKAQITLYEGVHESDNGDPVKAAVALDWYELTADGGEPAVMRRVWAPSIGQALEAMVADRRTDETLEQIELRASADGIAWPDL